MPRFQQSAGRAGRTSTDGAAIGAGISPNDQVYFESYANTGIHEEMIKDRSRMDTYQQAIMRNAAYISGCAVLDVGCGTGILSIFCARAGARKVYAVDASGIAEHAERIVADNGFADVITVIRGKMEEVELPEKVNVIVSEWMGYVLLYESMLDSVIYARDRWLNPGGLMLPSVATLYINPVSDPELYENSIDFWQDVYGINMTSLIPSAKKSVLSEPAVGLVSVENVLSWPAVIKRIDCTSATKDDVSRVEAAFKVTSMMMAELHGFVLWFDVNFPIRSEGSADVNMVASAKQGQVEIETGTRSQDTGTLQGQNGSGKSDGMLTLSTGPEKQPTHWQQTILYIDEPVRVDQDDVIEGKVQLSRNAENERFIDVALDFRTGKVQGTKKFKMV
ncbi:protein arginine N-methyltransferase [Klebsormidium nitens]|uniref:Protein arginine N-methyltransferase n=1 Tax=Klebsormidium nitens TaxID=105231 RepID=A0A1Y1IKD6_KLENI|nr:protein arginine N-methyltransferase [Klebsormidium nitens]|eukprot:GAQ90592.1 protein arginine N-methyltransferase [Klebsormidium nitens]